MKYISRCGIHCDDCEYKEEMSCPTCHEAGGKVFWGDCKLALCSIERNLIHCGECKEFVCDNLHGFSYAEENGDNGLRIKNLKQRIE